MIRSVRAAFTVAAVSLAVSATAAQAQIGFSIAGGPSFATGDFGEGLDMGYHAKVAASFSLPLLPIGLQADGMWTRFDVSDTDDAKVQILNGSLNAVLNIPSVGITPYIIGGVGLYNTEIDLGAFGSGKETDMGVNVGAGVRLGLPGLGGVFAEARLHNVFGDEDSYRFVPVSLGIRF
ncbi:MAG: outer membrane beta-barrel protein [Longimicrobiales bacterium]